MLNIKSHCLAMSLVPWIADIICTIGIAVMPKKDNSQTQSTIYNHVLEVRNANHTKTLPDYTIILNMHLSHSS